VAVPTFSSIDPLTGLTSARALTTVTGTNFRLASEASGGKPCVKVTLGGTVCTDVRVYSATLLSFLTPVRPAGAATLVIQNLDNAGAPIGGESVTVNNAYTYVAPDTTIQSDFERLLERLVQDMRIQIFGSEFAQNVVFTVNTDFSDTPNPTNVTRITTLPCIQITGPDLNENRFDSKHVPEVVSVGSGVYEIRRIPYTCDIVFGFMGITDGGTTEKSNLKALLINYFHKNKYLTMVRDTTDLSKGEVEYEMDFMPAGQPRSVGQPNESNIQSFLGRFYIRGFEFEDTAGHRDYRIGRTSEVTTTTATSVPI
jgi:hypothetical protein